MSVFDLTQLGDDDLRAVLFDALVERLEAIAQEDPSIALVNRMPTVLTVSRHGHLLTLSQGLGLSLLRGVLKWKDHREKLRTFNVGRATIQSRLAVTPGGIAGTPDEVLDWIVTRFLERSAPRAQSRPAVAEPIQESRPTARVQPKRLTLREVLQGRRATSAGSTQEPRPATSPTIRQSRPAPVGVAHSTSAEVTGESPPRPQRADKPSEPDAAPSRPAPIQEVKMTTSTLRTYQVLFETAQRQLKVAKALPVDSNKSFLISAGVSVALTAEAFFNDLGSRVISSWGQLQRLDPREKAEVLSVELFKDKVDWSVSPFQSVAAALGFRRALAHAHAETLSSEQGRTADRSANEVPRTRRTVWQEHCDVATIERWITDVRVLIEHFSRGYDGTGSALGMVDQPSTSSSDDESARKRS